MQKIVPHLWFDTQAQEAIDLYTRVFPNSLIDSQVTLSETPSGETNVFTFTVCGYQMMAINAGPYFHPNPAISFMVKFDLDQDEQAKQKLDLAWNELSRGGKVLMPLNKYDFSPYYGWVEDKYGVSWQLSISQSQGDQRSAVMPSLLFVDKAYGLAEEASSFYISTFKNSRRGQLVHYPKEMPSEKPETVMYTDFMLENQWFVAMDSGQKHEFNFNEAISLVILCETQEEIDYYWNRMSSVPEAEQCGWLKDAYGVSWQVTPTRLHQMISEGSDMQKQRVTKSFMQMKKFDLAKLEDAYGKE